jgi:hypothetical protein
MMENINERKEQTPKVLTQEFQDYGIWGPRPFKKIMLSNVFGYGQ